MELIPGTYTFLGLKNKYKQIPNIQVLICGKPGHGKTLFSEGIAEKLWKNGFLVIVLGDPKLENEWNYQMFPAEMRYHTDMLKKIGKKPEGRKCKFYHPFCFNLPSRKLPEQTFYTIPLKSLRRRELQFLAESEYESEAVGLFLSSLKTLKENEGVYSLLHKIQNLVRGSKGQKITKALKDNFWLDASAGTMKSVTEVSNYLRPFLENYFLASEDCPLNINWKELLQDQKHYHIFNCSWIDDSKLREFLVLYLLESILRNRRFLNTPIVFVIPEIRNLCSVRPQGAKLYLSNSIRDSLSLLRASGVGMSSILDSQVYMDISEEIRNNAQISFFGELMGADIEKTSKAFNWKTDIRDRLRHSAYPHSFILAGMEENEWTPLFPSAMHCEESYRWEDVYRARCPEKLQRYTDTINMMKKRLKEEEEEFRNKIIKREEKERERLEKLATEKEKITAEKESQMSKTKEARQLKKEKTEQLTKVIKNLKKDNPLMSLRDIAEEIERLGFRKLSRTTIKNHLDKKENV